MNTTNSQPKCQPELIDLARSAHIRATNAYFESVERAAKTAKELREIEEERVLLWEKYLDAANSGQYSVKYHEKALELLAKYRRIDDKANLYKKTDESAQATTRNMLAVTEACEDRLRFLQTTSDTKE